MEIGFWILGTFAFAIFCAAIFIGVNQTPEQANEMAYGQLNKAMVCPHCSQHGAVRTMQVKQKKGVSGGKATAALLTGGVSLLATGLSRKESNTQAHCDACSNTWFF